MVLATGRGIAIELQRVLGKLSDVGFRERHEREAAGQAGDARGVIESIRWRPSHRGRRTEPMLAPDEGAAAAAATGESGPHRVTQLTRGISMIDDDP